MATTFGIGKNAIVYDPFGVDGWYDALHFPSPHNEKEAKRLTRLPSDRISSSFVNTPISIDWKETNDIHLFKADFPGMKKGDVKVDVEDGRVLQISGERKLLDGEDDEEKDKEGGQWHRIERWHGKFIRRFRLPENAEIDGTKAVLDSGVLTVVVPKKAQFPPQIKHISVSS